MKKHWGSKMHKYALRYTWIPETRESGFTKDEILEKPEYGAADAILGISIILPEDGGYSQATFSIDGKENRPLTQKEIFKAWMMLGLSLHDNGELKGWQKDFVKIHSDMIRSLFNHSDNCATVKKGKNDEKAQTQ